MAEVSMFIEAPPERVYALLSDVTRMGEWSPECYRCEWLDGATGPEVGARFKGYNRRGISWWWTICEVTEAAPGRVFEFRVIDNLFSVGYRGKELSRWRYDFVPEGAGTKVTESNTFVSMPPLLRPIGFYLRRVNERRGDSIKTTLEGLKRVAESGTG